MFYLIDEKDELFDQKILVNSLTLKSIEVVTGDDDYSVVFTNNNDDTCFDFEPNALFDVNQVISEIATHPTKHLNNSFIVVTDLDNINSISNRFGHSSPIIRKANKILVNIYDFGLVYEKEGEYIITTAEKNIKIQESPEEIYQQLASKIVKVENTINTTVDTTPQWKKKL